jgi:hypothetical protein
VIFGQGSPAMAVLVVAVASVLLWWNLWRAIIFLFPGSVQLQVDAPPGMTPVTGALEGTHDELVQHGFKLLGTHLEHPRLGRTQLSWDYVDGQQQAFASLHVGARGRARLYLLTPTENGGFVLTANYRRPSREVKQRYLAGALEEVSFDRLWAAHQRRIPEVGTPKAEWTLEGRVAAGRAWFQGPGALELRLQNAVGLLWTVGALGMVGAAMFGRRS